MVSNPLVHPALQDDRSWIRTRINRQVAESINSASQIWGLPPCLIEALVTYLCNRTQATADHASTRLLCEAVRHRNAR